MKLIIGLGNPGEKYAATRHNVGCMVVDKLSQMVKGQGLMVKKTNTFMNESGLAVKKLINHYSLAIDHLYVIHDDLDLPLGTWKLQYAKGPKEHNGISDIEQKLGTKDFWRIRVGVDPTTPRLRGVPHGSDFVLGDFLPEEKIILDKVIFEICKKLATL